MAFLNVNSTTYFRTSLDSANISHPTTNPRHPNATSPHTSISQLFSAMSWDFWRENIINAVDVVVFIIKLLNTILKITPAGHVLTCQGWLIWAVHLASRKDGINNAARWSTRWPAFACNVKIRIFLWWQETWQSTLLRDWIKLAHMIANTGLNVELFDYSCEPDLCVIILWCHWNDVRFIYGDSMSVYIFTFLVTWCNITCFMMCGDLMYKYYYIFCDVILNILWRVVIWCNITCFVMCGDLM